MRILDLDKCKDLPPAQGFYYDRNGGYCAIGKVLVGLGFDMEAMKTNMYEVNEFMMAVGRAVDNVEWQTYIYDLNDSPEGNFLDNHEKAFRMAVDTLLKSGLVEIKASNYGTCTNPKVLR